MIYENEIVMLALGLGVYFFVIMHKKHLSRIPNWNLLHIAYGILLCAWTFTILEGFFWENSLNFLEHLCYAINAILLAIWCWKYLMSEHERIA